MPFWPRWHLHTLWEPITAFLHSARLFAARVVKQALCGLLRRPRLSCKARPRGTPRWKGELMINCWVSPTVEIACVQTFQQRRGG